MRTINLLAGDRASTDDVQMLSQDVFSVARASGNIDTIRIACSRWLEGETLLTATDDNTDVSLVLASPDVAATLAAAFVDSDTKITLTSSTGRRRIITLRARDVENSGASFVDYGWAA